MRIPSLPNLGNAGATSASKNEVRQTQPNFQLLGPKTTRPPCFYADFCSWEVTSQVVFKGRPVTCMCKRDECFDKGHAHNSDWRALHHTRGCLKDPRPRTLYYQIDWWEEEKGAHDSV